MPARSVVLDTNVVVSAVLTSAGLERFVLNLALAGRVQWIVSAPILAEYETVLLRPKFPFDRRQVKALLRRIRRDSLLVRPASRANLASDPDDNMFLDCARAGDADYLVTGNARHFPARWHGTHIVNARELLVALMPELTR